MYNTKFDQNFERTNLVVEEIEEKLVNSQNKFYTNPVLNSLVQFYANLFIVTPDFPLIYIKHVSSFFGNRCVLKKMNYTTIMTIYM